MRSSNGKDHEYKYDNSYTIKFPFTTIIADSFYYVRELLLRELDIEDLALTGAVIPAILLAKR